MKSETRIVLQIGDGIDFSCNDHIGVNCGLKYNISNLFGKGDFESDTTSTQYPLNDNACGRNISYLQLYAGVSYFIGDVTATKKVKK